VIGYWWQSSCENGNWLAGKTSRVFQMIKREGSGPQSSVEEENFSVRTKSYSPRSEYPVSEDLGDSDEF